jgi:hypothetical protein
MRAFYADGVEKMHVPWAVEGLPTLLHISLFLFFGGVAIFLFNLDEEVFTCVACWIGLFLILYGLITLLPLIRHESPYYTPLSKPAWYLYTIILYAFSLAVKACYDMYHRFRRRDLMDDMFEMDFNPLRLSSGVDTTWGRYHRWISAGMEKTAEETAEDQTSEIDLRILDWTFFDSLLGDDDSLEKFFQSIPGLFDSPRLKVIKYDFSPFALPMFWEALEGFMDRSWSVTESIKIRRDNMCTDIVRVSLPGFVRGTIIDITTRSAVGRSLVRTQEHDDNWVEVASAVYRLPTGVFRRHRTLGGDSGLLAIMIDICRHNLHEEIEGWNLIDDFSKIDIRHTLPTLQHDFCTLWNELVQEARNRGYNSIPVKILRWIRHLYISLHQGTDAAPTAFSASTDLLDRVLFETSSYPLCDIASHRPDSQLHPSPSGGSTALRQIEQPSTAGPSSPSDPTTHSKIGDSSRDPATTEPAVALPVHTGLYPTDPSPPGSALPHIPSAAALPHTPNFTQQDIVTAGAASAANLSLPLSSVPSFSIPALPPSSHVPPSTNTESLAFLSSTTPFLPTSNATLPRLRARGLVSSGGMCFANSILQLLLHSPPFWNLFRKLGDLNRQRGAGLPETGDSATPLADATVKFFDEFIFKEEPPSQLPQQAAGGILKEAEESTKEHGVKGPFEPSYLYDVMKEKEHLKGLLVRSCDQDSPFYH